MSSKAERYYDSIRADRDAWKAERLAEYPRCWICGARSSLVVHEIAKRSVAPYKWGLRANYFLACNECNCGILESPVLHYMLALKMLRDPQHYNRAAVNRLRGRADDAIDADEVARAIFGLAMHCLRRSLRACETMCVTGVLDGTDENDRSWDHWPSAL